MLKVGNIFNHKNEGRRDAVSKTSDPRIFAKIAKISLGLRKFRWDCENFTTIAKISQS